MKKSAITSKNTLVQTPCERFASTRFGQYVINAGYRILKVIEQTANCNLAENNPNGVCKRPLSWLPFWILFILLRLVCVVLSLFKLILGEAPIFPHDIAGSVRQQRLRLGVLRSHGLNVIHFRKREELATQANDTSMMGKFKQMWSQAICIPGHYCETVKAEQIIVKQPRRIERHSDGGKHNEYGTVYLIGDSDGDFVCDFNAECSTDATKDQDSDDDIEVGLVPKPKPKVTFKKLQISESGDDRTTDEA